jgi:hypothetical protein
MNSLLVCQRNSQLNPHLNSVLFGRKRFLTGGERDLTAGEKLWAKEGELRARLNRSRVAGTLEAFASTGMLLFPFVTHQSPSNTFLGVAFGYIGLIPVFARLLFQDVLTTALGQSQKCRLDLTYQLPAAKKPKKPT